MTTKQIAEAVGKEERTIRRWVNCVADKMAAVADKMAASAPNAPADYTLDETLAIIQHGMGKNAADLYRMNARQDSAPASTGGVLTARDLEFIAALVARVVAPLTDRMDKIEARIDAKQALLPAPTMDEKSQVNKIVREYAVSVGEPFGKAWADLYRDFGYRTHTNPTASAKNRGMAIIDYIEAEGQLGTLLAIAVDMYGGV